MGQQPIEAEPFMKPVTKKIAPDYDKGVSPRPVLFPPYLYFAPPPFLQRITRLAY